MDFFEESKKIEDICLMLHKREVDARRKEKEKFNKLTEEEKEVYLAEKKIRKRFEKQRRNESSNRKNTNRKININYILKTLNRF